MNQTSTITDVLSGNKAIRVDVGFDIKDTLLLAITLFTTIVIAGVIIKKI